MSEKTKEEIYRQDCENYRYQDRSKWSRFQTASVVQGAVVYAVFEINRFSLPERFWIAVGWALFVLTICGLAWKDGIDAGIYLDRMIVVERQEDVQWQGGRFKIGKLLLSVQIAIVFAFNLWIIMKLFGDCHGCIPNWDTLTLSIERLSAKANSLPKIFG